LYSDRVLVTNARANLSTEPDAAFATWETLRTGRLRLVPREDHPNEFLDLEGTPDWVLEVVGRGSVDKDSRLLRKRYHRAGVPEYWLIDALGDEIDFQILVRRARDYARAPVRGGWCDSPVFGRALRLRRRRDRLGFWQYTLEAERARG
jgi:Uma2 family endonuclease